MNACFYTAIDRLPLGTVAAIEFLPVIALAALGARTARNVLALALAVGGVYLLTDVQLTVEPVGLVFAFANAVLFALYIVLADRVAKHPAVGGIDGLAAAMLIALVCITPSAGAQALPAFGEPAVLLAGIGVGVTSSVIPYIADQLALARLPRATYALMVALLPGDGDRGRHRRARAGPRRGRSGRRRAGGVGRRGAPRTRTGNRVDQAVTAVAIAV